MLGFAKARQVGIDDGGHGAFVAEVDLNLAKVLALFEQVGGVRMSQRMDMGLLFNAAGIEGQAESPLEGGAAHRLGGGGSAQAAVTFGGKQEGRMAVGFPLLAQEQQGALGQGDVAVAIAFARANMQEHASGIDVGHLKAQTFAQPQTAGVDRDEADALVEQGNFGQNEADLAGGKYDGELELGGGADQLDLGGPGTAKGFLPEHLEGADGLSGGGTTEATLGFEVEEVLAQFLGCGLFGGLVQVLGQVANTGQIADLGARLQGQQAQVVGEAD